jgi:hypothetical protein
MAPKLKRTLRKLQALSARLSASLAVHSSRAAASACRLTACGHVVPGCRVATRTLSLSMRHIFKIALPSMTHDDLNSDEHHEVKSQASVGCRSKLNFKVTQTNSLLNKLIQLNMGRMVLFANFY